VPLLNYNKDIYCVAHRIQPRVLSRHFQSCLLSSTFFIYPHFSYPIFFFVVHKETSPTRKGEEHLGIPSRCLWLFNHLLSTKGIHPLTSVVMVTALFYNCHQMRHASELNPKLTLNCSWHEGYIGSGKTAEVSGQLCAWFAGFLLIFRTWWWRRYVPPKRWAFSELHGTTTYKNELYIFTTVGTSKPTFINLYKCYVSGHFSSSCLYLKTPSCLFSRT
jgi:hypothetical protein